MGNLVAASRLLKAGADPNFLDDDMEESRLGYRQVKTLDYHTYAEIKGFESAGKRWRREGACVNPLSFAAMKGHSRMTELLLQMGANINHQNAFGRSTLLYAAQYHQEAVVKLLLQHGSTVDSQDRGGHTPLSHAIMRSTEGFRSLHVVSALLDYGANVNHRNRVASTPLHGAVFEEDEEMMSLLITRGAKANLEDNRGTPLSKAVRRGWIKGARLLLQAGAPADYIDGKSRSALSYAVAGDSADCVELLLEQGAEINRPNTILAFCEQIYYTLGMISPGGLKYEYNLRQDGPDDNSRSRPTDHMLELLLSRGAKPNRLAATHSSTVRLSSPLSYAIENAGIGLRGTKGIIEMLLKHGAKIDREDDSDSVLMWTKRHKDNVRSLLLQYGILCDSEDGLEPNDNNII